MVFLTRSLRFINVFKSDHFRKWYFGLEGYNKYGLYHDDWFFADTPEINETLRRLPPHLYDEHCYRVIRASQLEMTKMYLPKEEWPTYEENMTKGRFLQPYYKEVMAEKKEKEEWDKFMSQ